MIESLILTALIVTTEPPCSRPVIEPQAGHGLFTHIRRLPDICLPGEPMALLDLPHDELVALPYTPFTPMLPPDGLYALPQRKTTGSERLAEFS